MNRRWIKRDICSHFFSDIICESQKKNSVLIWCSCLTDHKISLLEKQRGLLWVSGQTKSIPRQDQSLAKLWRTYNLCVPSSLLLIVAFCCDLLLASRRRTSLKTLWYAVTATRSIALPSLRCTFILSELDNL